MTNYDHKLVFLIEELTDCGMVVPLNAVVEHWGRELPARVIRDGFAVVRPGPDARRSDSLDNDNFMPVDDAVVLLNHLKMSDDYVIAEGPWAPICREEEPRLILSYAADEPKAVAEVRSGNAQRREAWERKRAST